MQDSILQRKYEFANIITHAFGFLAGLVATPILLAVSIHYGATIYQIIGLGIFCFSLLLTYAASTVYHSISSPEWKHLFRQIDHISIYFLIAGTNTPIMLYYADNWIGVIYLWIMWSLVIAGIFYKVFFFGQYERVSLIFYVFLGWMAIFIIPFIWEKIPIPCLFWILAGGLSYTIGVVFYSWEKLAFHHAIWHLFVIGGSLGHYLAILYMVINT